MKKRERTRQNCFFQSDLGYTMQTHAQIEPHDFPGRGSWHPLCPNLLYIVLYIYIYIPNEMSLASGLPFDTICGVVLRMFLTPSQRQCRMRTKEYVNHVHSLRARFLNLWWNTIRMWHPIGPLWGSNHVKRIWNICDRMRVTFFSKCPCGFQNSAYWGRLPVVWVLNILKVANGILY